MSEDQPVSRDTKNIWIIILAVVVTVLLGAILGFIASGGLSDEPTSELATGTTTSSTPPVTTTPPASSVPQTQPPVTGALGELLFPAIEDTYTKSNDPEDISGFDDTLELENDPPDVKHTLLRFDAGATPNEEFIEQITLRLFVVFSSGAAIEVHRVDGPWTEVETVSLTAPAVGELIATIRPGAVEGAIVEVDLTGLVTVSGPIDLYLTTIGDDTIEVASRESGANAPTLIVRSTP